MSVTVTKEVQTHNGLQRETVRTWIADNGHVVTVTTKQNITCGVSWAGRNNKEAKVYYSCECGKNGIEFGSPKKAHLTKHDSTWATQEERDAIKATLTALIGA
jgi:hypothetical protein